MLFIGTISCDFILVLFNISLTSVTAYLPVFPSVPLWRRHERFGSRMAEVSWQSQSAGALKRCCPSQKCEPHFGCLLFSSLRNFAPLESAPAKFEPVIDALCARAQRSLGPMSARMSPAPKTRQLLLDKCRFKYSWAAGVTRGTTSAIEWQKRDLETAFAEIDGLMAGLHYQDKAENNMTQAESPMQSPSGLVHASVFDTQQYPTDILDKDLLGDTADGYTATAEPIPGTEHQPMAPQWAAIRSLRDETAFHHKRFQLVARSLDNPIISKLLSVYPDARSIRNKGAQLVKDVLEGFQPRELPLLFAFASFSYAISQLLYKKGHIDRGDILADLRTWRDLISDPSERQAFSLLAQELWPEAKDRLHFLPMPPRSSAAPFPNPPPGEAILAGTAEFAAPVFPYFPANGQVTEDRNVDLYPSDPFGLDNTTSQSALDSDLVPNLVELFNGTHATFDFAAINSFDNQPYRQPPSCTSWSQSNGLDPPGCPRVQKRTGDTPGVEREQLPSVNGESKEVKLADTGMFLVILVFLQDIGELLYILSGRSLPSRRCKLYKAEEEDQKVFYKSAQKAFFKPRYQCQNSNLPTFLAILSVAETFTKSGFLRSIAEIKHYLASVATVRPLNIHAGQLFLIVTNEISGSHSAGSSL